MRQRRTTIAIAHRLSTIRDANFDFSFRQRADCRTRTHETLLAEGGTFMRICISYKVRKFNVTTERVK